MENREASNGRERICPFLQKECIKTECGLWLDHIGYRIPGESEIRYGVCSLVVMPLLLAGMMGQPSIQPARAAGVQGPLGVLRP